MNCIAVHLLTEIRDALNEMNGHLRNLDTLKHKREVKAEQQRRYRASCNSSVDTTTRVDTTKEEEKGEKESPPHTPSIGKEGKEEESSPPRVREAVKNRDQLFTQFWDAYPGPRKRRRPDCRKLFFKILYDPKTRMETFEKIMSGLNRWKQHDTWMRDGGRFIQAPLVWLESEDWDAEIAVGRLSEPHPRLSPRESAFERDRAEAERIHRESVALACRILDENRDIFETPFKKGPSHD